MILDDDILLFEIISLEIYKNLYLLTLFLTNKYFFNSFFLSHSPPNHSKILFYASILWEKYFLESSQPSYEL